MSIRKIALLALIFAASPAFSAKLPQAAQSAGNPEGKRLTELASQCAEEYSDLSGEISSRLTKFRAAEATLSAHGRAALRGVVNKQNLGKEDCIDISSMLTIR